jgi:hypothetical protein
MYNQKIEWDHYNEYMFNESKRHKVWPGCYLVRWNTPSYWPLLEEMLTEGYVSKVEAVECITHLGKKQTRLSVAFLYLMYMQS